MFKRAEPWKVTNTIRETPRESTEKLCFLWRDSLQCSAPSSLTPQLKSVLRLRRNVEWIMSRNTALIVESFLRRWLMGSAERCMDSDVWHPDTESWSVTARVLCLHRSRLSSYRLQPSWLLRHWPTTDLPTKYITVSNNSFKLLLGNMQMMASPSDSSQPVQCGIIMLLSSLDVGEFCSSYSALQPTTLKCKRGIW